MANQYEDRFPSDADDPVDWVGKTKGALKFTGEVAKEVGIQVGGDMFIPPMLRPEHIQRDESEFSYAGTGNNLSDVLPWAMDRANDVSSYRLDRLVPDKIGGKAVTKFTDDMLSGFAKKGAEKGVLGSVAKTVADSRFLPNSGAVANISTGLGIGVGVPIATGIAADYYQNGGTGPLGLLPARENPKAQYIKAVKAGDRELADSIAADINGRARVALGAKTIANGVSTGSALGLKGVAIGSAAAAGVVGLQNIFPATEFEPAPDAFWNSPMGRARSFRHKFGTKYEKADKFSDEDYAGFEDQYAHYLGDDYDEETEKFNMGVINKIRAFSEAGDESATAAYKRLYDKRQNHKD